ncbi:hydrogenase formation protein HypD [Chloroflexota bacterium]
MKFIDEYRDPQLGQKILDRIRRHSTKPARFMEFCGGHTTAIFRHGIRQLLPDTIEMLSGPGCPVCVTANRDLDKAMAFAGLPNVIIASFGDMLRVPGSYSSLQQAKAEGQDIRVVYSTDDALNIARHNPDKAVIFIGIGFETTAPTVASSILQAEAEGINNYYILPLHKLCPPIMKAILDLGEVRIGGIIGPGHVSAIIGSYPYHFIPRDYGIACVVSGFEPLDILLAVDMLVDQIETGQRKVEIAYRRGVKPEGNSSALGLINTVFEVCDTDWRGIGVVPASGLKLGRRYQRFDAESNFHIDPGPTLEAKGCICGRILRGVSTPLECQLFHNSCTPEHPVGPCMVSAEGSCAAYYQYGDSNGG